MNKLGIFLAACLMIFAFSLAQSETMSEWERHIDRPGSDYQVLTSTSTPTSAPPSINALECQTQCALDPKCKAWNYDPRGEQPQCFLKDTVPPAVYSLGLVSGVKLCATMTVDEKNTDRPGGDYLDFDLPSPYARMNIIICKNQCAIDPQCMAWNYDPRGEAPHCFLKSTANITPFESDGLYSGTKTSHCEISQCD